MKKYLPGFSFLLLLLLCSTSAGYAQSAADSLLIKWNNEKETATPQHKLEVLRDLISNLGSTASDSAVAFCNLARMIADESGDSVNQAFFSIKEGWYHYVLGEYDLALEHFLYGLDMSRKIGDKHLIAVGLNSVGLINNMHNQERQAIENHRQSIAICRETGDTLLWAHNFHNIGLALDNLKSYDTALMYADSSLMLLSMIGNTTDPFQIYVFKGWVYLNKGELQKAESEYNRVTKNPAYQNKWEISWALWGLATIQMKRKNFDQAIDYGVKSLELAREVGALWDLQETASLLADCYAAKGDFKEAYAYQVLFKRYSDSLFNETKEKQINYLQLQHQEDENLKLAQENEINEQRLKRKNFQLIVYTIGIALLVLLALALYQKIVQKNRLNRKLGQINATKDTLFHIMAHDIKSPMSIMISFTELLLEGFDEFSKPEILEIIKRLNKSSREGMQLLENLGDWARSQTGKLTFAPQKLKLHKAVQEILQLLIGNANAKEITVENDIPGDIACTADPNMTAVIIRNLVSNAIKFTPEKGSIRISAVSLDEVVRISVTDTGVGIPPGDMDKLFNIETTFSTPGTKQEKGSGIGLMLSKLFVTHQGGEIGVESEPGKGSTFYFTLPL